MWITGWSPSTMTAQLFMGGGESYGHFFKTNPFSQNKNITEKDSNDLSGESGSPVIEAAPLKGTMQ